VVATGTDRDCGRAGPWREIRVHRVRGLGFK